ncbi:hypothetical protein [Polycladidibacter hongkongensis]|uniref:nucleotide-binding protein n=1 Tax=Polycladidibacter hongkongensis TaxID=1647556 RepID=UPI00082E5697|nr:hypothetical protein [Pseudovibrio hongkongensis]
MSQVHIVIQVKGGAGKSFISASLAQYFAGVEKDLICIDADSGNPTFSGYKGLNVNPVDIQDGHNINQRAFDQIVEKFIEAEAETVFVMDTGGSTFMPLCAYLKEADVLQLLRDNGVEVMFHVPVASGGAVRDTANGLNALLENFTETPVVLWQNELEGPVVLNGTPLLESALYTSNVTRFHALGTVRRWSKDTFGPDIQEMLDKRLTYKEACAKDNKAFSIMSKQRLRTVWADLEAQISKMNL